MNQNRLFVPIIVCYFLVNFSNFTAVSVCSGQCNYGICTATSFCLYGCKDGYWGARCANPCSRKYCYGTKCYRDPINVDGNERYKCQTCPDGFYRGSTSDTFECIARCPENCKSCYKDNTCEACQKSFYNSDASYNCSLTCPERCATCLSPTRCTECISPYSNYGGVSDCSTIVCPKNCVNCTSATCTSCIDGFFNVSNNCSTPCPGSCFSCLSKEKCLKCNAGYYNGYEMENLDKRYSENCSWSCKSNCEECTEYNLCQKCVNGTYGSLCENQCSVGCKFNTCEKETGACDCKNSYSGDKCCVPNLHCKNCSSATVCSACEEGHYGRACEHSCKETCSGGCDIRSGECNGCAINRYGEFCENRCSLGCFNVASYTSSCNATDGNCLRGCINGFYGDKCDNKCEAVCQGGCNASSGVCKDCFPFCSVNCSLGCLNSTSSVSTCNTSTGACLFGCEYGFFTEFCNKSCSQTCKDGCEQSTGRCLSCQMDKYGPYCNSSCTEKCLSENNETKCNETNGVCLSGCIKGYYGEQCTEACSDKCAQNVCNSSSGECLLGCQGDLCSEDLSFDEQDNIEGEVVSGVVIGVVLLAVISGVVIFFVRRREKRDNDKMSLVAQFTSNTADSSNEPAVDQIRAESSLDPTDSCNMTAVGARLSELLEILPESELVEEIEYTNTKQQTYTNSTLKINVSSLYNYVKEHTFEFFKEEFKLLPVGLIKPYTCAQKRENVIKNRYTGIYPYDDSRVKIKGDQTFFINACYIDGYSKEKAFIASLGPTKKAMENFSLFWKMVWYEQSDIIVMLTNLQEATGTKCEQYWPELGESLPYGDVTVACHSEETFADHIVRTFTVMKKKTKRTVTQLHYSAWPDQGVPDNIVSLVDFWLRVRAVPRLTGGPVIVHCSAGIGRTGTYIALDRLTEEGKGSGSVNVYGCVLDMRQQRVNMVQTVEQYIYLHKALAYNLTLQSKVLVVDVLNNSPALTEENVQLQFQHLSKELDDEKNEEKEARYRNKGYSHKNRAGADIPGNRHRPRLRLNRTSNDIDYVNAVYLNSYRIKDSFIVAQTPLPSTVEDFLCLIYQEDCCCIVCLNDVSTKAKNVGRYLPLGNQPLTAGPFILKTAAECRSTACFDQKKFTLEFKNQPTKTIKHFHYTAWKQGQAVPESVTDFVDFINTVKDNVEKIPDERTPTVLVHCLTGAERSGLFCAVAVLREKIQYEGQVCVSNTLRQIKSRRKTAIPNKNQLEFCYQCVSAYLDINCMYSNLASVQTMKT